VKTIITGMGRSGSMWLAEYLQVKHEPRSYLNKEIFYGLCNDNLSNHTDLIKNIVDGLRDDHIEVNSFMRLSIKELIECGINVIGLIRHPQFVATSMWNAEVFASDDKRLLDNLKIKLGFDSSDSFSRMKCLLRLWNLTAVALLKYCDANIIKFEKLLSNEEYANEIGKLLDIPFNSVRWNEYKNQKINVTSKVSKYAFDWCIDEDANKKMLYNECGDMMNRFGYEFVKIRGKHYE